MAEEAETGELKLAQDVIYCPKCGWPPEYCEFRPDFATRCRDWLEENHPDLLPEKYRVEQAAAKLAALEVGSDDDEDSDGGKKKKKKSKKSKKDKKAKKAKKKKKKKKRRGSDEDSDEEDEHDSEDEESSSDESDDGKKSKKSKKKKGVQFSDEPSKPSGKGRKAEIHIKVNSRNRRKHITALAGLDLFPEAVGKLKDVAKKCSKKFACSAAQVKGTFGPEIHIQGDCSYDVGAFLADTYPDLPEKKIYIVSSTGKKQPGVMRFDNDSD